MAKITFDNKVDLTVKPIPEINKVTASNINEIKTVVNDLDDNKEDVSVFEDLNTPSTRTLSNSDDNIILDVDSTTTIVIPNGLDDIKVGVAVFNTSTITYSIGNTYTTNPVNIVELIKRNHFIRKDGSVLKFYGNNE